MSRRTITAAAAAGVALGAVILTVVPGRAPRIEPAGGALLSDCDGQIRELVIQYVPSAAAVVAPVYKDFLTQLPADATVRVVCPDGAAFDDLEARVGPVACRLSTVTVNHAMTSWARDRWLALSPAGEGPAVTLLRPRGEEGAAGWPHRAGDHRIAADLAAALAPGVRHKTSRLYFDGGDFVSDGRVAFVAPAVAERNIQHTVADRKELLETLRAELGCRVVLLEEAPPHHAGMYMMPIGGGRVMVGDPRLAREAAPGWEVPEAVLPCGADFSPETQELFDAVAARCAAEGYEVIRIPTVPGRDGRTYLTYLNVIIDERDGGRIAYMPVYRGTETLNAAAGEVWRRAGYEVRPVDCTSAYAHFGSLRCLVNVLRR